MCKKVNAVREKVKEGTHHVLLHQKRPITIVHLVTVVDGVRHSATEYAKVQWPDWYNRQRGVDVAVGKATKRIAEAIVNGEVVDESFERFGDIQSAKAGVK